MNNRFYPNVLYAREWIDAGNLGEVLSFRGVYLHSGSADPKTHGLEAGRRPAGGGVLLDLGTHLVDIARWLMEISRKSIISTCTLPLPGRTGRARDR